jgi:hypothetical protein
MKILKRTFPKTRNAYSYKQMLELNILIMQAFLPEAFTNKERDILVLYCMHSKSPKDVFSRATKQAVLKASGLKDGITLNEYNKRLRNKMGFIYSTAIKDWQINPMFMIPDYVDGLELSLIINKRDVLDR